jgi:hypothetical protein
LFPTTDLPWEPLSAFVELGTSKCQHALAKWRKTHEEKITAPSEL